MGEAEKVNAFEQVGFSMPVRPGDEIEIGREANVQPVQVAEMMKGQTVDPHAGKGRIRWMDAW